MKLATVIILLLHSIPISIAKGCYCQCSDSPSSPQCTKCIGTDDNCSKFQETCRYYESIHAPNCQNERVINGVYQTKSDCCSDQFVSQNFSTSPNYINIRGQVFFKNYNTNLFVLYQPDYPPSIDFPDQSYDNTTCAHRCCRKARMITASNCTSDWKACAVADSNGIPCDANKTIGCSIWIPCDDETNQAFFGGFSFSVLFVIYCCFFCPSIHQSRNPIFGSFNRDLHSGVGDYVVYCACRHREIQAMENGYTGRHGLHFIPILRSVLQRHIKRHKHSGEQVLRRQAV